MRREFGGGTPEPANIHHEGQVSVAAFHPDGLQLLTADTTAAYQRDFFEEDRQLQDLELLYQLLSSASIDESGSMVALMPMR